MLRTSIVGCAVFAAIAFPSTARADSPSHDLSGSTLIISADRLMPLVTYERVTASDPNNSDNSATLSATSVALLTNGKQNTFYTLPRLGLDVVVAQGLTLGGSAWVYTDLSQSVDQKSAAATNIPSQDLPKTTYWGVAPRVGYIVPIGDVVAFWPRVGIEYHKEDASTVHNSAGGITLTSGGGQEYQLAADVEAGLVVTPISHVGIMATVYGAIPIVGGTSGLDLNGFSTGSTDHFSTSQLAIGLTFGLMAYF